MGDAQNEHRMRRLIDAVHGSVRASSGASTAFELAVQRAPDPLLIVGQRTVDEVDRRNCNRLRKPFFERSCRGTRKHDVVATLGHL